MPDPNLGNVEYEGTVLDMGALYTTMTTASGEVLKLPNCSVVTSALVLGEAPLQADIEVALPPGPPPPHRGGAAGAAAVGDRRRHRAAASAGDGARR